MANLLSPIKSVLRISLPLVGAQLGVVGLTVMDTIMLGRFSPSALEAAGLGSIWITAVIMLLTGLGMGVDGLVSQAVAARQTKRLANFLTAGLIWSQLIAIVGFLILFFSDAWLGIFVTGEALLTNAALFMRWQAFSLFPFCAYMVFRQRLIAENRTVPIFIVLVLCNILNAGMNGVLIYGYGSIQAMGIAGSALSTTFVRSMQLIFIIAVILSLKPSIALRVGKLNLDVLKTIALMGLPIGFQLAVESGVLQSTSLLVYHLQSGLLGFHVASLNIFLLAFIVPMALSLGLCALVGHAKARSIHALQSIKSLISAALILQFIYTVVLTLGLVCLRDSLMGSFGIMLDQADDHVWTLVAMAGFVWTYGTAVIYGGALRGLGQTIGPSLVNLFALIIGLIGAAFAFKAYPTLTHCIWLPLMAAMIFATWIHRRHSSLRGNV